MKIQGITKTVAVFTSRKGVEYTNLILETDQGDLVKLLIRGNGIKKGDYLTAEVDLLTKGVFGEKA